MDRQVWMVQDNMSDGSADSIVLFEDKSDAQEFIKAEIEELKATYGENEDFKCFHNEDVVILQFSEIEITIYLREMAVKKVDIPRFFEDKEWAKEVNLSEEEIEALDKIEYSYFKAHGFDKLAGGYTKLNIEDFDEDLNILTIGVEGGRPELYGELDRIYFNRHTLEVEIELDL